MRALGSVVASGAAALSLLPSFAFSAIVDAGTLTTVSVEAPLYDPDISAATGCPPAGCVGDLTRVSQVPGLILTVPSRPKTTRSKFPNYSHGTSVARSVAG